MIDKEILTATVERAIEGTDLFLVEVLVRPGNEIVVELDSPTAVDIEQCVAVTRAVEAAFDREVEDYELEVGSAGLTSPFKVKAQFERNIGNEVEVLTRDGRKFSGVLTAVGDEDFTVEVPVKVRHEGAKRPVVEMHPQTLRRDACKSVCYKINFK